MNDLRFHSTRLDLKSRERDGQIEASRSSAAWIEVEYTIVHLDLREWPNTTAEMPFRTGSIASCERSWIM